MIEPDGRETLVWPTDLTDPTPPPDGLVDLLATHRLVVLGYYPVPDQSTPEQLRADREDEAAGAVASVADAVRERGVDVEETVVFTRDHEETIDRVAAEHGADAVLTPGTVHESITRVFVPVRGDGNLDRIVSFVAGLVTGSDAGVTLYNVTGSEDAASTGEFLLRGAADRLAEEGIDRDRVDWTVERGGDPVGSILGAATDHDLLVIGESEPSLRERILGNAAGELVDAATQPVAVVRDA
ncbi:universal stress protein [Halorubrum sp. BOL3-1]|uniref:universal stress protein n=1 Tax=Halorubrum sp. BOL3-1 TaxID=2497325 RepID=UPI0010050B8A|nr:universal stress protein [Halorubrum sp. BOL3-1]QAU12073.1 universal stress protein [Halorubrum sp. BOL3-1]